ncbi:hypothetical protein G9A89_014462 [Geosiphon pyriformis]|nr:hypothetical protein G9A89_014462 [Geosiphon pyriformis]
MSTQSSIFAISSVIEDALEKNWKLWLVLQDMYKAYDSVDWEHLKRSLVRIKICNKFIRFFGSIYNSRINRVMMDFGLTDGYHVYDGLDQGEVFLSLLWCIFYDLLLCEIKRQESVCSYRLISHFVSKTGQVESQAELMMFMAAGAFINDTIWISSSQTVIQHILNFASDFFCLNNILINNDKTVAILINCQITAPYLTISGMLIFITKRDEPHHYLGIFLSSKGLLKLNLVKTHLDVRFFVNLILKKAISDKQFAYLVSSVLLPIISYRTQFSFIPLSSLKSKSGLPLDFSNDALHHPSLYNLKTFEQIQTESKSASVITFANSVGVLGCLFSHRSYNLQVLSWRPHHSLLFPVHVGVSPSNNFLAGVVHIFSGCDLFLDGSLADAFHLRSSTPMSLVFGEMIFFKCVSFLKHYGIAFVEQLHDWNGVVFDWKTFKYWKRLDFHGPVPFWFDLFVCFLGSVAFLSGHFPHGGSFGFGVICNDLLNVGAARLSVYTDRSLSNLGTVDMLAGAAVFFEDIDLGLSVRVSGLVSSTLVELQTIALALECVPSSRLVDLFLDSQVAIDACRSKSLLAGPDFRNCCWVEHCHIANVIYHKNLDINWIKVKGHSRVSGNVRADALAKNAALSAWHLPHLVSERFLKAGIDTVSGNSRHFVRNVFRSIHRVYWEIGSGSQIVLGCMCANIDWLRFSLVWHSDSHMVAGFTSTQTAGFRTYFMKALHHRLPVAVRKRLYDRIYSSVVCLFCDEVEVLDHVFSCSFDADSCTSLLDTLAAAWEMRSGLFHFSSCVLQLLSTCISDVAVSTALCKDFSVSVYKDPKMVVVKVVDFVQKFCLAFYDNIWLVCAKHQAIMEKNKLIPCDGSISVTVSGFSTWLLGIANALGISFEYHKCCLFYAGVGNMASIHISV